MDASSDIIALDDFQHRPVEFLARLRECGRPVVLTVEGKAALVVQDAASYQKLAEPAEEAAVLDGVGRGLGLDDVKAGRSQTLAEAFDETRRSRPTHDLRDPNRREGQGRHLREYGPTSWREVAPGPHKVG